MNCREFIIEFEDRNALSEPATLHLTICADCKNISDRQTRLWLMVEELKPVAAPNDFDFRVKARIANAKPSDFQKPRLLPILRYVLPLSVAAVILGLFVFNSTYFSDTQTSTQIARTNIEAPKINTDSTANFSPSNQLAFTPPSGDFAPVTNETSIAQIPSKTPQKAELNQGKKVETAKLSTTRSMKVPVKTAAKDSDGGSHLIASTGTSIRTPKGINLNANVSNAANIEAPRTINDEQLLSFNGMETALENGKRTVKSLAKNSVADRSGVKVGDVIEQIKNSVLTITRGTEKLEITLRNEVTAPR